VNGVRLEDTFSDYRLRTAGAREEALLESRYGSRRYQLKSANFPQTDNALDRVGEELEGLLPGCGGGVWRRGDVDYVLD
jgi:hypothetical protein